MTSVINTNLMSLNAQRNLSTTQSALAQAVQRLSSGLRVNSAADDAAGLAIADRMNSQIRGMAVAGRNANDAISLSQTAESALGSMGDMLQRMRELAVQAANGTNGTDDSTSLNNEFSQLTAEITRVANTTKFNGNAILSTTDFTFQIGANNSSDDQLTISGSDIVNGTGMKTVLNSDSLSSTTAAQSAIDNIDTAISEVDVARGTFGAAQNRLQTVVANLQVAGENATAARSRIMDADFASETANLTRAQVLQQAGVAMLSQANQMPNTVLSLLK